MALGLLADHEALERQACHTGHGDHGAGDGIGADRHPADGMRQRPGRLEAVEDRPADEHRPVGIEHHLLGVEIETRHPARREREGAPLQGTGCDEVDQVAGA